LNEIDNLINEGYISRRKHPTENLFILNYTPKTQYESFWNELTLQCRGLIVDSDFNIKARCFKKFFNYEEVKEEVGNKVSSGIGFSFSEKLDGSLGILYWINEIPFVATRGSFSSEQAIKASEILHQNREIKKLDPKLTYLFEIIYPQNRICVNYGNEEKLIFLSAFETESGAELQDIKVPFESAKNYIFEKDFEQIKNMNLPNKEGFVVKFEDGYRFKIKFADYVKLHSLIFSLSTKSIWNYLREGSEINLEEVPDEIFKSAKSFEQQLRDQFLQIEKECKLFFESIKSLNRKEFAEQALKFNFSSVLFNMLDNKDYRDIIWKKIEPNYRVIRHEEI
jgi:RNA ligase